ncbi:hypothetical protein KA119_00220 [Candidatus Gracilibacteria bacterium]|nr:hypothetical protein [Candidatus Gracilibacteria bacterium]
MLKRLFTSNTRVKLLTVFISNPGEEFFIRELTRKLDEQINSVRRELDNLKKIGLLKSKTKNRKKYFHINEDFIFFQELRSIIIKALSSNDKLTSDLKKLGDLEMIIFSGLFTNRETESVDLLLVGEIDREKLNDYIQNQIKTARPVKFTVMSRADYQYRLDCHDRFVNELLADPQNEVIQRKK